MQESDLEVVMDIEERSYPFPWTLGIFTDCLKVGYPSWVLQDENEVIGYILFSAGADEAHLLNLCISPDRRREGWGKILLSEMLSLLREKGYASLFLEVRTSNESAMYLYESLGFERIGLRKNYYKAQDGREDAVTYKLVL